MIRKFIVDSLGFYLICSLQCSIDGNIMYYIKIPDLPEVGLVALNVKNGVITFVRILLTETG